MIEKSGIDQEFYNGVKDDIIDGLNLPVERAVSTIRNQVYHAVREESYYE
jgi:hypothetical protein